MVRSAWVSLTLLALATDFLSMHEVTMKNTRTPAAAMRPIRTLKAIVQRTNTSVFSVPPKTRTSSMGTHCSARLRLLVAMLVSLPRL